MQMPGMGGAAAVGGSLSSSALERTSRTLQKILERLSTAKRINRASDDASGLSVAEQLTTQVRGFKMASQNVEDAMSALDIADSTAGQVTDMLQRQRELAIQARSDTLTDSQRRQIDVEYQALNQEIDRITGSANYNRQNVAGGQDLASGNAQIQVGANSGDTLNLPPVNINTATLGTAGTSVATAGGAANALVSIDSALGRLNTERSRLGATVNRLESTLNNLSVSMTNTQAAESVLRDQDMAMGVTQLTTAQLLREGGTRAFARYREIAANHLYALLQ